MIVDLAVQALQYAMEDTHLTVESMELSGSEESDSQLEPMKQRECIALERIPRKRLRQHDEYETTIRSKTLSGGEDYVSRSGRGVRAKEMGPGCKENCRFKCHSRMTYEERLGVHTGFYRTAQTLSQQWEYIRQTVNKAPKKESTREESRRANTYTYSFFIKKEALRVCKTMYLSTLQISNTVVETAFHKSEENFTISSNKQSDLQVPNSSSRIAHEVKDCVKENINAFPGVTHRTYVLWLLKKQALESSPLDDLSLSADRKNDCDMSSEDCSGSGSDVRAQVPVSGAALIHDAAGDLALNIVSTEMQFSESEESSCGSQTESENAKQNPRRHHSHPKVTARSKTSHKEVARIGKTFRAKEMGPGCKENCRFNCHSRVSHDERLEVYHDFYRNTPTLEQQWEYVCRTVQKMPKKESTREESRRANSYTYSFRIKEEDRRVCKTMYLSTLQVSNSVVETAFQKRRENGTMFPCKRGKVPLPTNSSRRIPQNLKDSVREHINKFPPIPPKCCGKETTKKYLQDGLTVAKMHRMYVPWMLRKKSTATLLTNDQVNPEVANRHDTYSEDIAADRSHIECQFRSVDPTLINGKVIATERQYRDIFDTEFNLAFPSKRTKCDQCGAFMRDGAEKKH